MPLDWLKKNIASARSALAAEVSKYKNRDFMEAVVAGCAIVAAADGEISGEEKRKMLGFVQNSEELKAFSTDEVIAAFGRVTSKFDFDHAIGVAEALKAVGKLRSEPGAARLMVRVCIAIGMADGDFDAKERDAVRTICKELGLDASEFDL